jgi:hypothetical protein
MVMGSAKTFFEERKSLHGVAEPAPIGVQTITRNKGDQAPDMRDAEAGKRTAS